MRLNSISKERSGKMDFSDISYCRDTVSLDLEDVFGYLNTIPEPEQEEVLTAEEKSKRDVVWDDIKFICGEILTPDYYIMYARYYLGHSFREVAKTFGKSTFANTIVARERKVLNKLKFIYCKPGDGSTKCNNKGCNHKVVGKRTVCPKCGSTNVSYTTRIPYRTNKSKKL